MKRIVAALAVMAAAPAYSAGISYTYLEAGYSSGSVETALGEVDPTGWEAGGSFAIAENFAIGASVSAATADLFGIDLDTNAVGVEVVFHAPIADRLDGVAFVGASNVELEIEALNLSDDDTGTVGGIGLRFLPRDQVELFVMAMAQDAFDNGENALQVGVQGNPTDSISVGIAYMTMDDSKTTTGYLRFNF